VRLCDIAVRRAAQTPDRVAYRFIDGALNERALVTYGQLDQRARELGGTLAAWTRSGARVIIALDSGPEFVLCLFACLYTGRVAVPALASRRANAAWDRLLSLMRDARPELVIVESAAIAARLANETAARGCRIETFGEFAAAVAAELKPLATSGEPELALLQYTSGSTGDPKGVMLTEASLQANLDAIRICFGHSEDSHMISWLPMHHDMGLIGCVLEPFYVGFPVTLLSALDVVQRPARWLQAIGRYRGTVSGAPPFAYRACLDRVRDDQLAGVDLSSWRVAFVGAERVPDALLRRFGERFAPHGLSPDAVRACYGLAEATLLVSFMSKPARLCPPSIAQADGEHSGPAMASCGECIPMHELICVDTHGRLCGEGECGEIWVRGPSVAAGYYGRTQENERVFGAYCEGRGPYLRTGDRGLLRDNQVYVVGRIKDLVIVRGRKFAPEDIEATVATSHAFVAGAIGAAFSLAREDGEVLVVVQEVTRSAMRELDLDEACAAIREQLTSVHGVSPAAIALTAPGSVPRTTSGKVQRGRCRELFMQQQLALVGGTHSPAAGKHAPASDVRGLGEA